MMEMDRVLISIYVIMNTLNKKYSCRLITLMYHTVPMMEICRQGFKSQQCYNVIMYTQNGNRITILTPIGVS